MKVTTFTDTMIKKLKPEEKKYTRSEGNGFTIRIMPSGVKSWLYLFNFDGNRLEMNFGIYPDVSLETARQKFEDAKKKVKNGINPKEEEENNAEARRKAPTVADLVDDYIKKHAMKFKKSWKDDERLLNKEIIPLWGKRKAVDITKRDVILLLESIVDRGTPAMSNQVLKIVRKMFNFAIERDILEHTPCTKVKALAPNTRRERKLNEAEIKTLWGKLDSAAISDEIKRALKLVLTTAQRPGEVAGLHTKEIDGNWWTIPPERAKNGYEHRVYLTKTACEIISDAIESAKLSKEIPADQEYIGFVFPCPHKKKEQSIDSHALPVAVRRNLAWQLTDKKGKPLYDEDGNPVTENRLGIDQFTPHDLRRTASTFMASMKFMDEVINAVLNHVKQGIIRTYNLHHYDKEKQEALEAWEKKLTSIVR
jgi:integrase